MKEPQKLFSVAFPYAVFEELRAVARRMDVPVCKVIRDAVNSFLEKAKKRVAIED